MDRLPLIGGSYSARSILANCQRCLNLFPELNRKDSPCPVTHYQRPGFLPLTSPNFPVPGRGAYQASQGDCYVVLGSTVYYVSPAWELVPIGQITAGRSNICYMQDNGTQVMLVDGSSQGWFWNLADKGATSFSSITDPSFTGADRVDYIDTFLLWNVPGTQDFRSSLSNQIQPMDPTYTAGKTDYPDPLQTLIVNRHEILLPGLFKGEIWYDAGNAQFPFAELPGYNIEHGIGAKYSIAAADISVFWLGRDQQSGEQGMVFRQRGYQTSRISNHALEYQMQLMAEAGADLSDAVGYTYQQGGHVFYVLSFVSGNQTWVFDDAIADPEAAWAQRCWTDANGGLNRDRSNVGCPMYGKIVVLDWENGTLYSLDRKTYTDTVSGTSGPITYLRTFPHLMSGLTLQGQAVLANGKMVQHSRFLLDATTGTGPRLDANGDPPKFTLKYSDDRGVTWSASVLQSAGEQGKYMTRTEWKGLGMAMDRVYEVSWSFPGEVALNGAWVEGSVLNQ